jgi:hypothetical protein
MNFIQHKFQFTMRVNGVDGVCKVDTHEELTHEKLTFVILHIFNSHVSCGNKPTGFFFERT